MARCAFGPAAVAIGGRYLGVWISAAVASALHMGRRWERAALDAVAVRSGQRPVETVDKLSRKMTVYPGLVRGARNS
eukprot:11184275-Lingulodinium_polyedra.AAC.1